MELCAVVRGAELEQEFTATTRSFNELFGFTGPILGAATGLETKAVI